MALGTNTTFYETPNHPYQGERIAAEAGLVSTYGLKNKEELWRSESELRQYRREARDLIGSAGGDIGTAEREGQEFVARLRRIGVLADEESLDDVLALEVTDILERRLQTQVYRKGYANTTEQARQFIAHGHITVEGRQVRVPSYTVRTTEESTISFDSSSPLTDELHPERAEE
ncbi:MAG: SSU ribosomal protein S4P [halophilic archaeon J07HX64]|jgi:SSU ribosomal protein S4P|nr:MAG: SSU ribosomal protein S4P [halophilic archaeon J07HX64]